MVLLIFALESVMLRIDKAFSAATAARQELLKAVSKSAVFELSSQLQVAASRCCAYVLKGGDLVEMQKKVTTLSACPVEELLEAKHLLSQAAQESG